MFTLDNFIYIYHLNKFCVLPTMPDSVSDNMNSTFSSTTALSRSAPVWSYANSGPRSITFNLDLHRDIMEDINKNVSNLKDNVIDFTDADYIDVLLNYLQACALPKYNIYKEGSKVVEPPQVAIKMGRDIFIRGIVNSGVTVSYEKPILDNERYARVKVTFSVTEVDPYDAPTVAMSGGFRGVTATFKSGIYKDDSDTSNYNGQEFTTVSVTSSPTTIRTNTGRSRWDNSGVKDRLTTQKVEGGSKEEEPTGGNDDDINNGSNTSWTEEPSVLVYDPTGNYLVLIPISDVIRVKRHEDWFNPNTNEQYTEEEKKELIRKYELWVRMKNKGTFREKYGNDSSKVGTGTFKGAGAGIDIATTYYGQSYGGSSRGAGAGRR